MPSTIAIIGAGPLGRWLAVSAARAGFRVLLEDVMPTNLRHAQEAIRRELSPNGNVPGGNVPDGNVPAGDAPQGDALKGETPNGHMKDGSGVDDVGATLSKIAFVSTVEDAVREADLAIDCVPDELESKLEILWLMDRMAPPRTVLATPTTKLSILDLASCTYRPDKCVAIVAAPSELTAGANSALELRVTPQTSSETIELVTQFWTSLGAQPKIAAEQTDSAGY